MLKTQQAKINRGSYVQAQIGDLESKVCSEITRLAEKWAVKSKAKWAEKGERSTRYFFACFKNRQSKVCQKIIKVPESEGERGIDTLHYIRNYYEGLYKKEGIDYDAMEEIVGSPPKVTENMNKQLLKELTKEEIEQVIRSLPTNKSLTRY